MILFSCGSLRSPHISTKPRSCWCYFQRMQQLDGQGHRVIMMVQGGGLQGHHKGGIPESAVENRAGSHQALTCTSCPRYMGARQATQGPSASQEAKKQQSVQTVALFSCGESQCQTGCPAHVHAGIKRTILFYFFWSSLQNYENSLLGTGFQLSKMQRTLALGSSDDCLM